MGTPPMITGGLPGADQGLETFPLTYAEGRARTMADESNVTVLDTDIARKFDKHAGDTIELKGVPFTVVGVLAPTLTAPDQLASVPLAAAQQLLTPGTKNPHLSITKDATETGFNAVGDVIHYSITATNDGNITLHNVTVTDPNVSDLGLHAGQSGRQPGPGRVDHLHGQPHDHPGRHRCRHYFNQACVDDGAGGAAQACDDVTTPGTKNPHLTITKDATETGFRRGRRRHPLHDHGDQRRQLTLARRDRDRSERRAT